MNRKTMRTPGMANPNRVHKAMPVGEVEDANIPQIMMNTKHKPVTQTEKDIDQAVKQK